MERERERPQSCLQSEATKWSYKMARTNDVLFWLRVGGPVLLAK
jgi:hypothetical protein